MQRFGMILERFISPEGPSRIRAFHYLPHRYPPTIGFGWLAWMVAQELSNGQVRAAMTAVINRMFGDNRNFNERFSDIGIQWFPASYLRLVY